MGAPIKINKDLLVISLNYTKKWLSEGQPKVSGLRSQVTLPIAPSALPPSFQKTISMSNEIKERGCPSAPSPTGRIVSCLGGV